MSNMYRLALAGGLVVVAALILIVGMTRNVASLLAPVNLLIFVIAIALYLAPTALAIYRDCKSVLWIGALNILLGWTLFGWAAAIGWAAAGEVQPTGPGALHPPNHPLTSH